MLANAQALSTIDHPFFAECPLDVTLVVPCYNEEANVVGTLENIVEACRVSRCSYEIILFDDCSKDNTMANALDFQRRHPDVPLRVYHNPTNQGLTHNFVEGAVLGKGKYIRIVCGDNVEPVDTLTTIFDHMGRADMILPFHQQIGNKGWFRTFVSQAYTRLVNLVSGHKLPYWNGCGLFCRYHVLRYAPSTRGFGFQAQLVSALLNAGATALPVECHYTERAAGTSSAMSIKNLRSVFHVLASIFLRRIDRWIFGKKHVTSPELRRPAHGHPETMSASGTPQDVRRCA